MRNKVIAGLILSLTVLVGLAKGKSAVEYVVPTSIISVKFTKKCKAISGSLAQCDGVMVSFAAVSFSKQPSHSVINHKNLEGLELK